MPFASCAAIFCKSFTELDLAKLVGFEVLRVVCRTLFIIPSPPLFCEKPFCRLVSLRLYDFTVQSCPFHLK